MGCFHVRRMMAIVEAHSQSRKALQVKFSHEIGKAFYLLRQLRWPWSKPALGKAASARRGCLSA